MKVSNLNGFPFATTEVTLVPDLDVVGRPVVRPDALEG